MNIYIRYHNYKNKFTLYKNNQINIKQNINKYYKN